MSEEGKKKADEVQLVVGNNIPAGQIPNLLPAMPETPAQKLAAAALLKLRNGKPETPPQGNPFIKPAPSPTVDFTKEVSQMQGEGSGKTSGSVGAPVDPNAPVEPTPTTVSQYQAGTIEAAPLDVGTTSQPLPHYMTEGNTLEYMPEENRAIYSMGELAIKQSEDAAIKAAKAKVDYATALENEAKRREAAANKIKAAEAERIRQEQEDILRKDQQAAQASAVALMAGNFFANTEKFNSTILAAGLARAGLVDQGLSVVRDSIAREYNMQRQAIEEAKMRGERSDNMLSRLRGIYQSERAADLAFETLASDAAARKLQAMAEKSQGALDESAAVAMATQLRMKNLENMRTKNLAERKLTSNPEVLKMSGPEFARAVGWGAGSAGQATGATVGGGGAGPQSGQSATGGGSTGGATAARGKGGPRVFTSQFGLTAGSPAYNAAIKWAKTQEGLEATDKVVNIRDPRSGNEYRNVRILAPKGKAVFDAGGAYYTVGDQKQLEDLNKMKSGYVNARTNATKLKSTLDRLAALKVGPDGISKQERLTLEKEVGALQTMMQNSWWKTFEPGVMQTGEVKRAEEATGSANTVMAKLNNLANQLSKGSVGHTDWNNDLAAARAGATVIESVAAQSSLVDHLNRMGFAPVTRSAPFQYDKNGRVVPVTEGNPSPIYMLVQ